MTSYFSLQHGSTALKQSWHKLVRGVWLFPAILAFAGIILTTLDINGSSIGIYHTIFYGNTKDSHLLLNHPQAIRSDEWLVNTQLTIAQHAAGYPLVNPNIDIGHDMSVVGDAPYKDWSEVFRPQNLAFFVLPFQHAFAFKWWLLPTLTILGCYFVTLRFFKGKRLFAALVSSAIGCSPFLFWWYQTETFGPMFYGFFIILIGLRIIYDEKINLFNGRLSSLSKPIYIVALGYLLSCFALILYPPFQIPIAIVTGLFLIGAFLDRYGQRSKIFSKSALMKLGVFLLCGILAGVVVAAFVYTRPAVIKAVTNTAYPGKRITLGGGTPVYTIVSSYLQPQLQHGVNAAHYYTNQSEASNFILFVPFLVIPGFILLFTEYKKLHKIDWQLLTVQFCTSLFLAHMFVPGLSPLYRSFFLDKVPHGRLLIGLGFAGILQLFLIIQAIGRLKISKARLNIFSGVYTLLCLAVMTWAGEFVRLHYPLFIHSALLIGFFGIFFSAIIFCFLSKRLLLGAMLFFLFSIGSVFRIHPLYRGLGPLYNSKLSQSIDAVSGLGGTWVNVNNIYFENAAFLSNRDSLSGVQLYPNVAFWRLVNGSKDDYIYNRYAHVLFNTSTHLTGPMQLIQPDSFQVQFACTPFIKKHVQFVVAEQPLEESCTSPAGIVSYPAITFYLYRVH